MTRFFLPGLFALLALSSCSHSYFIVRHAEKEAQAANMSSDVPLSPVGETRAMALRGILQGRKISYVYSTNTIRTKSTAQPTAGYFGVAVEIYGPRPDSSFIRLLKSKKKNVLIVGHSNTVDDIVNMLCSETKVPGDLPESEYNKIFIVTKKGKHYSFREKPIYP